MEALHQIDAWDVPFAAAGVTRAAGDVATRGDTTRPVRLASVSKPVTALAVLVAAEEGVLDLDEAAGPPGATVRHLLAHTSGLPFDGGTPIAQPGRRRIYSNEGFRVLGDHLAERAEMPFAEYVRAAVVEPLGISLDPEGHPGAGMHASLDDVLALGRELLAPRLVAAETHAEMVSVQFPGLDGVLPDFGRFSPLDWGLGVELKGDEGAALVGLAHVARDVRALRRERDVPLGRPGARARLRRPDRARLRGLGEGRLAPALGCRARGARMSASEPIIRLAGVTKRFGRTVAVDDVTIDVPRGRCLGWLGPNGSGKTTLIRCMLGLARVTAGTIEVRGREVPRDVRDALAGVGGDRRGAALLSVPLGAAEPGGLRRASSATRRSAGSTPRSSAST